ncbi:Shedu anti-phage system protein SduA domain-containing protein, partial [Sulfitobacter geojensis]|uniref:Shedu anti-phage system protein SduA domain-containing protein n=2 Tax=Roseobacteraceae TaxID=2854170 RepID=UPI003B8E0E6A
SGFSFAHSKDANALKDQIHDLDFSNRFPHADSYDTAIHTIDGAGALFELEQGCGSLCLEQCTLLNHREGIFRSRNIMFLGVIKSEACKKELVQFFDTVLPLPQSPRDSAKLTGVFHVDETEADIFQASMLQNLFLLEWIRETTIDNFLEKHPDIIARAFGATQVKFNLELDWVEHDGRVKEKSIKPDVMIQREDGYYDIADLKLALLDKTSLTTSKRDRRRFIVSVGDGLAQLANYAHYFTFEKNRQHAKEKYGIDVINPKKTLIVGHAENLDHNEALEALRAYDSKYAVVDYDTLISKFLQKDRSKPR